MRMLASGGQLDRLGQPLDRGTGRDGEPCRLQAVDVVVVDLEAVTVTLVDRVAVDAGQQRAGAHRAALCAQSHGAAQA